MATNPQDKSTDNKNTPSLFGGGLFAGNTGALSAGLFGNASKGAPLFGTPSPSSAPGTVSPAGQQPPITPLFGSGQGQPMSAPGNLEAGRSGGLFSGGFGKSTLGGGAQNEGNPQNALGLGTVNAGSLGLFAQNTQGTVPSLFGPPRNPTPPEPTLSASSTPANPTPAPSNPLNFSFGSAQDGKKEEAGKKQETPSLFGGPGLTGSLFGGQTNTGLGMFGQTAKPQEGEKKDEKKQTPGSLFGGMTSSADFKNMLAPKKAEPAGQPTPPPATSLTAPPKAEEKKETPKADTTKNLPTGSLFGSNPVPSLFGSAPSGPMPSLFGGNTPNPATNPSPSPAPTSTPAPSMFKAPDAKQPSLFGASGTSAPSLFGGQPTPPPTSEQSKTTETPSIGLFTQSLPKTEKAPTKDASSQPQTGTIKPEGLFTQEPKLTVSSFLPTDSKPAPTFFSAEVKQAKKQATAAPSLFGGSTTTGLFSNKPAQELIPNIPSQKPEQLNTASEPKPATQLKQLDGGLTSFTERRRKQPVPEQEQPPTVRSNQSESSFLTKQKTHNDFITSESKNPGTIGAGENTTQPISFLKQQKGNPAQILDYKALKQEEKGEMFSTFLSQSSANIINSIKMYFTVRTEAFKPREQPPSPSEKQRFLFDFTSLFVKVLGLTDHSWALASQFVRRVITEQKYERLLFKEEALSSDYFRNHAIYQVGLGNSFFLNEAGSRELQFLVERVVNKWNVERVGLLNFLLAYSDLMKRPSDLFAYLFRHLLEMDGKNIETNNQQYRTFIRDFEYLTKRKLLEVIAHNNTAQKSFKLIPIEEVKGLVKLLEENRDDSVNEVSLKVLLNCINFKQHKELPADIFDVIRQTKSQVMMPLRALVHRLSSKRSEFVPCPKDLYRYIRGDEWADWFDIYLSDSGRDVVELQSGEPEQILEALCSISGPQLLQRMLRGHRGLLRFFHMLRDQNMVVLYYRLLETCITDEKSIGEVEEFYFKKMHFNQEYQEVIEYVVGFGQQQPHANEEAVLAVLEAKLSLLAKIIEISPDRLLDLERYLFYRDYNRHKKFKPTAPEEFPRAEGEKLVHLFLDAVNIVSLKGIANRMLHRIFRLLAHLLRSQQTERVALAALRTNRPSFAFLQTPLHPLTLNALNDLLEQVLTGPYLHDLVSGYSQAREDELRAEAFYPFRYRDAEFGNLLRHETGQGQGQTGETYFSIYWMNQLVKVVARQRFNPYLLFKLLEKLHIEPYNVDEAQTHPSGALYQKRPLDNKIPTIFEPIVFCLNELTVWEDVARVLEYKIVRSEGKLDLHNKLLLTAPSRDSERALLYTLKLVRLAFRLSALLAKHEESAGGHFAVRTLSAVNFLSRGKIGSQFASNATRNGIVLSVLALLPLAEGCEEEQAISWEAEQAEEEDTVYHALITFINRNKHSLDFEQANNFLKRPTNDLYEAENSITALSLEVLLEILRLSPECSLEHSLTTFLPLKEEEKTELKAGILAKLSTTLGSAIDDPSIEYRAIEFIYSLKYDAGANKLHGSLSGRLFEEFIRSGRRSTERSCTFNAVLCKYLLKELQDGNFGYQAFTEAFLQEAVGSLRFRDSFLRDFYDFKDTREIGRMVRAYHSREHSLLNLNQLERMVEERAIVEIGRQFETLTSVVDILMAQLLHRRHSQGLLNCLCLFNQLLLANNLLLLDRDLPAARPSPPALSPHPRLFLRDPLEAYASEGGPGRRAAAQVQQKNNVVEWLAARCRTLSGKVTGYVKFILTVDRYPYANNPVVFTIDRPDVASLDLFCHLSLGRMNFSASELFGKSSTDALETIQGIAANLITRLSELAKEGNEDRQAVDGLYSEGLKLFGYCLQWLRGKQKYGETASHYLIRKLQKNCQILLPHPSRFLTPDAIKVLLSALSMGEKHFSSEARVQVREAVYTIVERYWQALQRGFVEEERAIGELFQQAVTVLILLPPQKNESYVFELLVNIWARERNFQFFFNESRVLLELARLYPEELVKLQPLTRCEIITSLSPRYCRYADEERRFDGIAWTWTVRIAAELANHPLSILVVSEVSAFLKKYRERVQALFEPGDRLSKSYLEDLEAALQLLACLFAHDLWVNFNRKLAEELTYLLSHKLIRVFVLYAQGKLPFAALSANQKALAAVKCLGEEENSFDGLTQETVFSTEMRVRVNYCLRNYCLAMRRAFRSSHYVQAYFQAPILDGVKYFSSFWDGFNKQLVTLFVYAGKQFKLWAGQRKLNDALSTVAQCTAAPHSFVENGYLCTILDLPRNDFELFSDLYLLNYLLTELAALHLLKERLYVGRFNSLMGSHADAFAKRLREHVEVVRVESRKVNVEMGQYVGEGEFEAVVELIESSRVGK